MRTYLAQFKHYYDAPQSVVVAAPSFLEAWKKVKKLMKETGRKCTLLSIVQTAKLDA